MVKIKDVTQKLSTDHKDLHSSVSKVGKAVDRVGTFTYDFIAICFMSDITNKASGYFLSLF